nr:uncharacterized protein LOC127348554 isoform X2 [Lolium perenne]
MNARHRHGTRHGLMAGGNCLYPRPPLAEACLAELTLAAPQGAPRAAPSRNSSASAPRRGRPRHPWRTSPAPALVELARATLSRSSCGRSSSTARANRVALAGGACGSGRNFHWCGLPKADYFLGLCVFSPRFFFWICVNHSFGKVVLTEAAEAHDFFSPFNSIKVSSTTAGPDCEDQPRFGERCRRRRRGARSSR